jgi:hypothetical protein
MVTVIPAWASCPWICSASASVLLVLVSVIFSPLA